MIPPSTSNSPASTPRPCLRCGAPLPEDHPTGRPCPRCLLAAGLADSDPGLASVITGSLEARIPPAPEVLAPLFPKLEILGLIGQGGMGVVYRARQRELGREVALKLLWASAAEDADLAERFLREARTLARVAHPNIVAVHDFGRTGEYLFLVLELVDGLNLRQALRAGPIAPAQALAIVTQVCAALQFAHDQGVVHRDIKPENILLDRAGRVKIADFGLARVLERDAPRERLTRAGQAMGTPQYMAPEQLERPLTVDHRADIFSLGVVFYEILTGELPLGRFAAPSRKVQIDVRLDEVVLKALEKEPEQRYQRAGQVQTEVENIVSTPAPASAPSGAPGVPKSRSTLATVLIVLLVVLVALPLSCAAVMALFLGARTASVTAPAEPAGPEAAPGPGR